MKSVYLLLFSFCLACTAPDERTASEIPDIERGRSIGSDTATGNLFVIGGGKRSGRIIKAMLDKVEGEDGYILIFPHSSSEPDSSYHYIAKDFAAQTNKPIIQVKNGFLRNSLIDSVRLAPLIFLTGGDQNLFLQRVHPAVRNAINEAYFNGATVGGTSAGAALMSKVMITGDQRDWPEYEPTYSTIHHGNAIYQEGLGLIDSMVVDQHFVARSRYNRLISALADTGYPYAVGVDEETALVITPQHCTVVGDNQVVLLSRPKEFTNSNRRIGLRQMEMNIYLEGDTFKLNY